MKPSANILLLSALLLGPPLLPQLSATPPNSGKSVLDALSAEDQAKAREYMEAYKQAAVGKKKEYIEKATNLPREAREVFHRVVDADYTSALAVYREEFKVATAAQIKLSTSKETKAEIKRLQAEVLGLARLGDDEMKVKLKEIGAPALEQLKSLGRVTPKHVLDSSTTLTVHRARLLELIECRNLLRHALAVNDGKDFSEDTLKEEESALANRPPDLDRELAKVLDLNKQLESKVPPEEALGVRQTNELRLLLGLPPVALDPKLCDACRGHSKDMVERKFFAHESPVPGKKSPWDRAKLAGTSAGAENIFMGSERPQSAINAWFLSPGHNRNMLAPGHKRIGMGRHKGHWTQMFGG